VAPDELGGSDEEEEEEEELDDAERMQHDCEMLMQVLALAAAPITEHNDESVKLSRPPREAIVDVFSAVLGDAFHFMDRPKVPINHPFKKGYLVALTNAWFAWDPVIFEKVKASLRLNGLTDREISDKLYYDVAFFRRRVPRVVLPPSALYWRVRAVYVVYGPAADETGKPLFNKAAWAKADNVLKEILSGHASDPPGFAFYTQVWASSGCQPERVQARARAGASACAPTSPNPFPSISTVPLCRSPRRTATRL
jgi:hypothetical protein